MIDFAITQDGDLVPDINQDVYSCTDERLRQQMALCRIVSVSKDWHRDHIGADLEEMLGKPAIPETIQAMKEKIVDSLCFDKFFQTDNIYIKTSINNQSYVKIMVYIKTLNNKSSFCIDVSLDLVKGVNIKIGE